MTDSFVNQLPLEIFSTAVCNTVWECLSFLFCFIDPSFCPPAKATVSIIATGQLTLKPGGLASYILFSFKILQTLMLSLAFHINFRRALPKIC